MPFRTIARRLRLLLGRPAFERDVQDELAFHLEMQTLKNVQRGLPPDEARALAEREFGRAERWRDEVRDVRGATMLDDLGRDVRQGLRAMRRAPAVTARSAPRCCCSPPPSSPRPSPGARRARRSSCRGSRTRPPVPRAPRRSPIPPPRCSARASCP